MGLAVDDPALDARHRSGDSVGGLVEEAGRQTFEMRPCSLSRSPTVASRTLNKPAK
jgi:hypothetical protein